MLLGANCCMMAVAVVMPIAAALKHMPFGTCWYGVLKKLAMQRGSRLYEKKFRKKGLLKPLYL